MKLPGAEQTGGDERYGPVRVLCGERGGRYPDARSLLVEGERENVLIDPSLGLMGFASALPRVDRVLHSHCHEDHIAGSHLFPDAPWYFHEADRVGIHSLDAMTAIYGYQDASLNAGFRKALVDEFHYTPRDDARAFREGDEFDLGGVALRVIHSPGHTRGHCCFLVRWRDESGTTRRLLTLGDIDLASFGPYYGDSWSSLPDFEKSIARIREIEANWYVTSHHIGVLRRQACLERLDRFEAVIASRERRLLEYLREPHDLDEVAEERFVYRKGDDVPYANAVERRSMAQHIERLLADGRVRALGAGRYVSI